MDNVEHIANDYIVNKKNGINPPGNNNGINGVQINQRSKTPVITGRANPNIANINLHNNVGGVGNINNRDRDYMNNNHNINTNLYKPRINPIPISNNNRGEILKK